MDLVMDPIMALIMELRVIMEQTMGYPIITAGFQQVISIQVHLSLIHHIVFQTLILILQQVVPTLTGLIHKQLQIRTLTELNKHQQIL